MDAQGFAARLRTARERKGLKKAELSRLIGKSTSYITLWESGKRGKDAFPPADVLDALATHLGVTEDWLKGKTDDPRGMADAPPSPDAATVAEAVAFIEGQRGEEFQRRRAAYAERVPRARYEAWCVEARELIVRMQDTALRMVEFAE